MNDLGKAILLNHIEKSKSQVALNCHKYEDEDVNKASTIFGRIKLWQIKMHDLVDSKGKTSERLNAEEDLKHIFGISEKEINKLTPNQLYNLHTSKMVNAITSLIKKGEL